VRLGSEGCLSDGSGDQFIQRTMAELLPRTKRGGAVRIDEILITGSEGAAAGTITQGLLVTASATRTVLFLHSYRMGTWPAARNSEPGDNTGPHNGKTNE